MVSNLGLLRRMLDISSFLVAGNSSQRRRLVRTIHQASSSDSTCSDHLIMCTMAPLQTLLLSPCQRLKSQFLALTLGIYCSCLCCRQWCCLHWPRCIFWCCCSSLHETFPRQYCDFFLHYCCKQCMLLTLLDQFCSFNGLLQDLQAAFERASSSSASELVGRWTAQLRWRRRQCDHEMLTSTASNTFTYLFVCGASWRRSVSNAPAPTIRRHFLCFLFLGVVAVVDLLLQLCC